MAINLSAFSFDARSASPDNKGDFVARIPADLSSKKALFFAMKKELQLPDYFGENWDALSDCLRDLSWIKQRRVELRHEDVPPLDPKDLATYLDILSDAVQDWKRSEDHELVVAFPPASGEKLARFVKDFSSKYAAE